MSDETLGTTGVMREPPGPMGVRSLPPEPPVEEAPGEVVSSDVLSPASSLRDINLRLRQATVKPKEKSDKLDVKRVLSFHALQNVCYERKFRFMGTAGRFFVTCKLGPEACNCNVCPIWTNESQPVEPAPAKVDNTEIMTAVYKRLLVEGWPEDRAHAFVDIIEGKSEPRDYVVEPLIPRRPL